MGASAGCSGRGCRGIKGVDVDVSGKGNAGSAFIDPRFEIHVIAAAPA
jgi:hypothetical protein